MILSPPVGSAVDIQHRVFLFRCSQHLDVNSISSKVFIYKFIITLGYISFGHVFFTLDALLFCHRLTISFALAFLIRSISVSIYRLTFSFLSQYQNCKCNWIAVMHCYFIVFWPQNVDKVQIAC